MNQLSDQRDREQSILVDLGTPKNVRVLLFTLVVVLGTWASTAFHYVQGVYRSGAYPLNTFLFRPWDRFMDFYNDLGYASRFLGGDSTTVVYSPLSTTVMGAFTIVPSKRMALLLAMSAFMLTLVVLLWNFIVNDLRASLTLSLMVCAILATMAYPILFNLDRGNEEMFVFVALACFAYLYFIRRSPWAGVALGFAIGYKMYPMVLIVLFIADRRWRDFAVTVATALGLTALSTLLLGAVTGYGPAAVLRHWYTTLFAGHVGYANTLEAHQHGHSLWGALVTATGLVQNGDPMGLPSKEYVVFAFAAFTAISVYIVLFERSDWKRVTLLVTAMLLLPFESHDYTLVHMLIPFAMFVNSERNAWDLAFAALFGLLFIPIDYVLVIAEISTAAFIYPAAFVVMVLMIIWQRLLPGASGPDAPAARRG